MGFTRLVLSLGLPVVLLIAPARVRADHCGAGATVTPTSGPPTTTFVFETNLGAPSDLHLDRDGRRVRSVFLDDDAFVTYEIETRAGDAGSWRVRAEVRGHPECAAEATFTVIGIPDTSAVSDPSQNSAPRLLVFVAGAVAWTVVVHRLRVVRRS